MNYYLRNIIDKAILNDSWGEIYQSISSGSAKVEDVTKAVIEKNDAIRIFTFAYRVLIPLNIAFALDVASLFDNLAQALIRIGNAEIIYCFADIFANDVVGDPYIKEPTTEKLAQAIIETGNVEFMFYFARDVKGAPIEKLAQAVIETKDTYFIWLFARYVKDAPIGMLVDNLIELEAYEYITLLYYYLMDDTQNIDNELKMWTLKNEDRLLAIAARHIDEGNLQSMRSDYGEKAVDHFVVLLLRKLSQKQEIKISTQSAVPGMSATTKQLEEDGFDMLSPDGDGTRGNAPRRTRELPSTGDKF